MWCDWFLITPHKGFNMNGSMPKTFPGENMSRSFQQISVKSAEIIKSKLEEINDSKIIENVFIEPENYGGKILPNYIHWIQKEIDNANLINDLIGTQEIKISMDNGNNLFMIVQFLKEYEKRLSGL